LKTNEEADADLKKTKEKQFEYEFKDDYAEYKKRILTYDDNKVKAYAFLCELCSKGMKNNLQSRKDVDAFGKNPIYLLQAMKEHALNYEENKYETSIISHIDRDERKLKTVSHHWLSELQLLFIAVYVHFASDIFIHISTIINWYHLLQF